MSELERIIHDNSNGLDYILVGEIYLPLIAVSEEKRDIGFYGSLHRNYLKDYKGGLYSYLTLTSRDQMEWVRRANNVRSRVDEIILNELVYV